MEHLIEKDRRSIERVRAVLDAEVRQDGELADLWRGMAEDLRRLADGEPVADPDAE